jgi:hypothetical protein
MKLKLKTTREDRQKIILLLVCFSGVGLAALQSNTRNSTLLIVVVDRCLFGSEYDLYKKGAWSLD